MWILCVQWTMANPAPASRLIIRVCPPSLSLFQVFKWDLILYLQQWCSYIMGPALYPRRSHTHTLRPHVKECTCVRTYVRPAVLCIREDSEDLFWRPVKAARHRRNRGYVYREVSVSSKNIQQNQIRAGL